MDPIRRSQNGSITPVTDWILYADHGMDPIRRSVTPAFSLEEIRALRNNFDSWIAKARTDSINLRSLLRDYALILLDTGMRPGTEINELTWGQIEIKFYPTTNKTDLKQKDRKHEEVFAEDTVEINPNITAILKIGKGKTGARHCIGRGPTVTALTLACIQLNAN